MFLRTVMFTLLIGGSTEVLGSSAVASVLGCQAGAVADPFPLPTIVGNGVDKYSWNDASAGNDETADEKKAFSGESASEKKASEPDGSAALTESKSAAEQPAAPKSKVEKPAWPNPFTLATDPGQPEIPFPIFSYKAEKAVPSNQIGFMGRDPVFDVPPQGGILVGVIVGRNIGGFGSGGIVGLQGIYQVGDKYSKGEVLGDGGGLKEMLLAPPGYAVGGMEVQATTSVTSIRLGFNELGKASGKLKSKTFTASKRVGEGTGSSKNIDGEGRPMVCLSAKFREGSTVSSVGLVAVERLKVEKPATTDGIRSWNSANGKFSVEATFVSKADGKVTLKKSDGKTIAVKIDLLSPVDQKWLKAVK